MFDKKLLNEMFNFTTNKKKTIIRIIIHFLQAIPYLIGYQYVLSKVIDKYIPEKDVNMVIILSSILIGIIIYRFFIDKYGEIVRKTIYYDNDMQIKNKVFNAIHY